MRRFFRMYLVEQKLFMRSPDVILFNLMMPLGTFLLIALIAGSKTAGTTNMTYLQSSFVALTTVGICCSAFMSIPIVTVEYRSQKILKRMYCSPCSPARILACDAIASGVMSILSTLLLVVAAVVFFGYRMKGSVLLFAAIWLLTMISMFSIGLLVASLCRTTKSLNVATSLLYFPMLLLSGATIPAEILPAGLRMLSKVMPLGVGIDALKQVSMGQTGGLKYYVPILTLIAVICVTISIKTFKWE